MSRGALKLQNKRLAIPDRAQRVSGNHNFHRLPPKMLEPAKCKSGRSKQSLPRKSEALREQCLGRRNQAPCQDHSPPSARFEAFFSTRENKCAVFAGKFRELSIKNEQNSPLKKNMDVTIL
jgi:hypothetical protein